MGDAKRKARSPWKAGAVVRVTTPLFVARVGYPMAVHVEAERIGREQRPAIIAFMKSLGVNPQFPPELDDKPVDEIARAVAHRLCRQKKFGGRERAIHRVELPALAGVETEIQSVRFVKTGVYDPGGKTCGTWTSEEDYDPPCLLSEKTHRLLLTRLWAGDHGIQQSRGFLEIEAANVEVVRT